MLNMRSYLCVVLFFIVGYFIVPFVAQDHFSTHAAVLFLEPKEKTVQPSEQFEVTLKIDTQGESVLAADAVVLFDSTSLELVNITDAPQTDAFFPEYYKNIKNNNSVYIGAAVGPNAPAKAGTGSIAVLVFRGVTEATNLVSFDCEDGRTVDSNITTKQNSVITDIITCSALEDGRYTIASAGTTPTPGAGTPTAGPGTPSVTPNPSVTTAVTPSASVSPTSGSTSPTTNPTGQTSVTPSASTTQGSGTPTATSALTPGQSTTPGQTSGTPYPTTSIYPTPTALPGTGVVDMTLMAIGIGITLTIISLGIKIVL